MADKMKTGEFGYDAV